MSKKTTNQSGLRVSLERWVADSKAAPRRRTAAFTGIIASILLAFIAWWFWRTITLYDDMHSFNLLIYITPFGLAFAAAAGITGSVMLALRQRQAVDMLLFAFSCGVLFTIIAFVNGGFSLAQRSELELSGLGGAWSSFVNFNKIEIGNFHFSITGTITIVAVIATIMTAGQKGQKKK